MATRFTKFPPYAIDCFDIAELRENRDYCFAMNHHGTVWEIHPESGWRCFWTVSHRDQDDAQRYLFNP